MYNKTVMDHFRNPRNVGVIEDADGIGEVGNPLCGDMMTIYLKIKDEHISDIKFQTLKWLEVTLSCRYRLMESREGSQRSQSSS